MGMQTGTLRVICAGGFRAAMEQMVGDFTSDTGIEVNLTFGTPAKTRELVSAGTGFDVAVVTKGSLNEEASAQLEAGSSFIVAKSPVGMGLRMGLNPAPIDTVERFAAVIRSLGSVGLSDPKAGTNLGADVLAAAERLGFAEDLRSRAKFIHGPGSVVSAEVAKGSPDAVITLISEIITVDGVQFIGNIPDAMGLGTPFVAGRGKASEAIESGAKFLAFLQSEPARVKMRKTGLLPSE